MAVRASGIRLMWAHLTLLGKRSVLCARVLLAKQALMIDRSTSKALREVDIGVEIFK